MRIQTTWKTVLASILVLPTLAAGCSDDSDTGDDAAATGDSSTGFSPIETTGNGNTQGDTAQGTDEGSSSGGEPGSTSSSSEASTGGDSTGGSSGGEGTGSSTGSEGSTGEGSSTSGTGTDEGTTGTEEGTGSTGGEDESGSTGDPVEPVALENAGFEEGTPHVTLPGWTNEGDTDAAYVEYNSPRTDWGRLGHWRATAYIVSTSQTVTELPDGTYTFGLWVRRGAAFNDQYLFARGYSADDPLAEMTIPTDTANDSEYTLIELSGIPVTSGEVTIGIYSDGVDESWAHADDATLVMEP